MHACSLRAPYASHSPGAPRYHSLVVDRESLPGCLEVIAWTTGSHHAVVLPNNGGSACMSDGGDAARCEDVGGGCSSSSSSGGGASRGGYGTACEAEGLIMALAHRTRPHYSVQFHPESVCTRYGLAVLQNFIRLASRHLGCSIPR